MKIRVFLLTVALAAFGWVRVPATTSLMPIDEIKPGMVGTGRTIFEGSEMKDFKVHILGVLKNVQAPQRNLILARLEGGPLAETGVIAGMSGSPVYIDGRLDRRRLLLDRRVPEGTDRRHHADRRDDRGHGRHGGARRGTAPQARIELPVTPERLAAAIRANYARIATFADRPADVQAFGLPASAGSQMGALLRPIATPLVLSGMDSAHVRSRRRRCSATRASRRCSPAAPAATSPPETGPLRPGDPVGVSLLGGDGEMGATGTITHIDGDRALRVRPSLLQLRADRVPDDPRARLRDAAQPDVVVQDRHHGRSDRDDAAGSRDGDRGHARQGPGGHSDHHHARQRPRRRSAPSTTRPSTTSCSRRS